MKKKYVVASALALAMSLGLVISPKAQASSIAKYTKHQNKATKKYKHGSVAFSYQLIQLKGKSSAIKKINRDLKKKYTTQTKAKKALFNDAKSESKQDDYHFGYFDLTKTSVTYNKKNIISIRYTHDFSNGLINYFVIGGWNYSLKTGKKLNVFNVSKGSKNYIATKLYNGASQLGADNDYFSITDPTELEFFIKRGKVYVYPRVFVSNYTKSVVFTSRYK